MAEDRLTPACVADEILELVGQSAPGEPGVETRGQNDRLVVAAYGRVYRCFDSIRRLAAEGAADDALVLARALLATALTSAYLVQPGEADERQARLRRAILTYVEGRKRFAEEMRAAGLDTDAPEELDERRAAARRRCQAAPRRERPRRFTGPRPFLHAHLPHGLQGHPLRDRLDGFLERTPEEFGAELKGTVSLELPDQEKANEVLLMAAIT